MGRKQEISLLNVLFCILVIFIHITSAPVSALDKSSLAYAAVLIPWRLSAFVVQGFIFLSGLKLFLGYSKDKKTDYKKYYISRLKKIVLPYVLWVVIFYLYFVKNGYFPFNFAALLKYIADGGLVSHFYFVIIIVQFYLLLPLWRKMAEKIKPPAGILISLLIMLISGVIFKNFVYSDRIFTTYIIYWVLGCYTGIYYDRVVTHIKKNALIIFVLFTIIATIEAGAVYMHFSGRYIISGLEQLHILYSLSAIVFFFMLALRGGGAVMRLRLARLINSASYYIYLVHPLAIYIINDEMAKRGITGQTLTLLIRSVFVYAGTIALCGLYVKLKEKQK